MRNQKKRISIDEAHHQYGISCSHEIMPNGELRFRLASTDGSSYIRTVATPESGWQKSHYHKQIIETYIVQSGWMALASLRGGRVVIERFGPDEIVTTKVNEPHNVFLSPGTVIHTVKRGNTNIRDWWSHAKLDTLTENMTEADILAQCQEHKELE